MDGASGNAPAVPRVNGMPDAVNREIDPAGDQVAGLLLLMLVGRQFDAFSQSKFRHQGFLAVDQGLHRYSFHQIPVPFGRLGGKHGLDTSRIIG